MSYTTNLINQRRGQITGSQISGSQVDKKPKQTFTQQVIEQRRLNFDTFNNSRANISSEPIEIAKPPEEKSFFKKTSDFLGIGTGEVKGALQKAKDFITADRKAIGPGQVVDFGKNIFNMAKESVVKSIEEDKQKQQEYFGKDTDLRKLSFDQIRDYQTNKFLDIVQPDLEEDIKKIESKQKKSKIDEYRLKNMRATLDEVKKTKELPTNQKLKKDSFITGLALSRGTGALTAGLLNIGESFFDLVKWRSDVAEAEGLSEFSEQAGDRVASWAEEVRPNNPQFADKLLEGAGSTIPFYVTGLGVSSLAGRLATVSPKIAQVIGVGSSAFMEAGLEAGTTYQTNIDRGLSREEADTRASRVFAGNILFNYFTNKVGLFSDSEGVKKFIISGMGEGTQESWQNALQNVATDRQATEGMGETFILSFITGAGLSQFGSVVQDPAVRASLNDEDLAKLDKIAKAVEDSNGNPEKFNQALEEQGIKSNAKTEEKPEEVAKVEPTPKTAEVVSPTDGGEVTPGVETKKEVEVVSGGEDTTKKYERTYNLSNKDDVEYLKRIFSESQVKDMQKDVFSGNYTKEKVQEVINGNLINDATKVVSPKEKVKDILSTEPTKVVEKPESYKTKEDFAEAHVVYHGGDADFIKQLESGKGFNPTAEREAGTGGNFYGLSTTTNRKMAKDFSGSATQNPAVATLYISPTARVLDFKGRDGEFLDSMSEEEVAELAKKYDVIRDVDNIQGENEVRILNPKVLVNKKDIKLPKKVAKSPDKEPLKQAKKTPEKVEPKKDTKKEEAKKYKAQEPGQTKASKVAVSIEQKLGKKLDNIAGFETINIKDQLKKAEDLLNKNLIRARGMISGKIPLPDGLRTGAFIKAVEEYAKQTNDSSLLRSLAISPLVSETSIHAQELRLLAERDENSVLTKMQEIASERAKIAEKKYGKKAEKLIKDETAKIKSEIRKVDKHDWSDFIRSIEC